MRALPPGEGPRELVLLPVLRAVPRPGRVRGARRERPLPAARRREAVPAHGVARAKLLRDRLAVAAGATSRRAVPRGDGAPPAARRGRPAPPVDPGGPGGRT